jgi:hypothetical protein
MRLLIEAAIGYQETKTITLGENVMNDATHTINKIISFGNACKVPKEGLTDCISFA